MAGYYIALAADITLVRFLSWVAAHVFPQTYGLNKALATDFTLMLSCFPVAGRVSLKISIGRKLFGTNCTLMGHLSRVDAHVHVKI